MKFSHEKSSPSWHPYRYQVALPKEGIREGAQVTDSTVMRSKQIFFTLSPDGLTQFSLDHTVFIDLKRWLVYEKVKKTNFLPRWVRDAGIYQQMVDIGTFARFQFKVKDNSDCSQISAVEVLPVLAEGSEQTQVPECEASDPREAFHQLCGPSEDLL